MPIKNIPNSEQTVEFDKYIVFWQRLLNLSDWRIERGRKHAQPGAMAEVECNATARLATYRLGDWAGEEINAKSLSQTALHEVLHVFLYDLIETAKDYRSSDDHISAQEHKIINVLEKLLFSKD
jgi:hypothetical protein